MSNALLQASIFDCHHFGFGIGGGIYISNRAFAHLYAEEASGQHCSLDVVGIGSSDRGCHCEVHKNVLPPKCCGRQHS